MALFRKKPPSEADRIAAFWAWWTATGHATVGAAIEEGRPTGIADEISAKVKAVDPGLAWELAPGTVSRHLLIVTAEGDHAVRATARRWALAAPPSNESWSYSDQRAAAEHPTQLAIEAERRQIGFGEITVTTAPAGSRLDVVIHHPDFGGLSDEARQQLAFLALDATLGETRVELWIGRVDTAETPAAEGVDLDGLRDRVAEAEHAALDDDGQPSWSLLEGPGQDGPVLAAAQVPLHPAFAPHLTHHLEVRVAYAHRTPEGLPVDDSLTGVRAIEERLDEVLAADGRVVAHEASAGVYTVHAYVDATTDAARRAEEISYDWDEGVVDVRVTDDAGWKAVGHLAT